MDDEQHRKFVERMLATNKAEALSWLQGSPAGSFRNLGEMETNEESVAYVKRLYDAGAVEVIAVKIDEYDQDQNTGHLIVRLPEARYAREQVFALEREQAEAYGFDGSPDQGQTYIYLKLD